MSHRVKKLTVLRSVLQILGVILLLASQSCVSSPISDAILLERSKQTQPSWIQLKSNNFLDHGSKFYYVQKRQFRTSLTLGIQQTQSLAISNSKIAFVQYFKKNLTDVPGISELIKKGFSVNRLDAYVLKEVDMVGSQYVSISDIYYEHLQRPAKVSSPVSEDFYSIYVLVEFNKNLIDKIYGSFKASLITSNRPGVRAVGKALPRQVVAH